MTTVLVTGATGFVGSHALAALADRDNLRLIAACRDSARLPAVPVDAVRVGDLRDPTYLDSLLEGVDVLVHAAAWTSLWGHTALSQRLYLEPSLALIDRARSSGVRRFVNISTTSAAAPDTAADAMSLGISRPFWPHLNNVIRIEDRLRQQHDMAVVNLRLGLFAGRHYNLGLLPILLPRLKTHLVPWVVGGRTGMPIVDGRDIGQAVMLAATVPGIDGYRSFNIMGPEVPSTREVIQFLHDSHGLPKPHFSVPFSIAYAFAWLMEKLDPLVPWEPLVTRSIIHLLEETGADNDQAREQLGYRPQHHWQEAVREQLAEMAERQTRPMAMIRPVT